MLTQDTDFTCASKNNLYSCAPSTEGAKESYETLQMRLIQVANELATFRSDLPPALDALTVDGIMNATTALGAQTIIGIFAQTVPPPDTLTPMLTVGVSAQDLITLAAERSDLILAYIDGTIATAPQVVEPPPPAPVGWQMPSLKTIGIGLGVVGVVVGAVLYQRYTDRRDAGIEDNSDLFLPPGDGDDETDDDFDEGDGFDDFIEVDAVETIDDEADDDHDADSDDEAADTADTDAEETDDEADLDEGEADADAELEDDIDDAA